MGARAPLNIERAGAMKITELVDVALDRSLLGYTKLGSGLRKHWWAGDPEPLSMAGKRVVVTGATSGIGAAMAGSFAALGATVHLLGRNRDRVRASAAGIRASVAGSVVIEEICDVADLDVVSCWTAGLGGRISALHGLVHNAGLMPPQRQQSPQGHELQLATHVLGPHLMTERLLPLLIAGNGSSVIFMSSGGMYSSGLVDDLQFRSGDYNAVRVYARTKRMQVVLADAWARRQAGTTIRVESMHPGWVATPGVAQYLPLFGKLMRPLLRDTQDGADTAVWLVATRPGSRPGHFWHDRTQRPTTFGWQRGEDPDKVARFLTHVSELTATSTDWNTPAG